MTATLKRARFLPKALTRITRHTLAGVGLAVMALALSLALKPEWQMRANQQLLSWLEERQDQSIAATTFLSESARATVTPLQVLPQDQMAITQWLSRKYKVSPEPLGALVSEAWRIGERSQMAPTLLLAMMAIESRFNPFASGSQGTMGLMQIAPEAQSGALSQFGGRLAAFDPVTNLRIGARLLQDLIAQSPSLEEALGMYATASGTVDVPRYIERVLAEQKKLDQLGLNPVTSSLAQNKSSPAGL
jgi:soluble lytic murein transglycosylase-like protein